MGRRSRTESGPGVYHARIPMDAAEAARFRALAKKRGQPMAEVGRGLIAEAADRELGPEPKATPRNP